ncbi:CHAT domain-containing protein [Microcoleus vaginatus GB1-A2]|uniref:CHAT domain-containing protein n=1 Tax=Microcoleus vaginatus TaxID=119532 RepID=UPI00168A18AF|nr:CHAT domain-containing protein [Microcoleus sp. FACHB-61]
MLPDKYQKVHRCLPLVMGVVFATTYSIPISGQPRIPTLSQSPTTEKPNPSGTQQPVQAFGGQIAMFLGHEDRLTSAVFSPDGRKILTASTDKTARLWDIKGNLLTVFRGHEKLVFAPVFSPDGSQILTTSGDKTARLWDIQGNLLTEFRGSEDQPGIRSAVFSPDGSQILTVSMFADKAGIWDKLGLWDTKGNLKAEFQIRSGGSGGFLKAVFSPDGRQILTTGYDGTARLWDIQGNLLKEFQGHREPILSGVFSPDGRQFLTASQDKTARLWDTNGNLLTEFQGHENHVESAIFSPDGRQILTASIDGTARIWDTKGNLLTVFGQHGDSDWSSVESVAGFSPDGRQILTSSRDGSAQIWDTKGKLLAQLRGHNNSVGAVFSPDGRQILTRSWDKIARLWDVSAAIAAQSEQIAARETFQEGVSKNNAQLAIFGGHNSSVTSAAFSPDGRQILTASLDKKARLWDTKGNLLTEFQGHEDGVSTAIFSPDGRQILTTAYDGTTRLWDTKGNALAVLRGVGEAVTSAVFSPDGSQILPTDSAYPISLWDTKGNLLVKFWGPKEMGMGWIVYSAVFSPDGSQILTVSLDGTARLWDIKGNVLVEFQGSSLRRAIFSPDGRQILTASSDETARLWDIKGNVLVEFRGHKERIERAIFSPDGSQILTRDINNVRLWDIKGNLLAEFRGHEKGVTSAVFSPDASQILTASYDGTARVWDTKGNLLAALRGHDIERGVRSAVFSPDGRQILTASSDGTARLWDLSVAIAAQAEQIAARETFQESVSKNNAQLAELRDDKYGVKRAVFSPDGRQILTTTGTTVRLWHTKGNLLAELPGDENAVESAEFSPDGRQILTATDETVRLWDNKGNLLTEFQGREHRIDSAVFSPDGRQILTASIDKTARLWDTKGNLLAIFQGHERKVNSAVFSPDGRQILTASLDKTARLWDTKGNLLAVFRGHEGFIESAKFSPNGRQILTDSRYPYATARLWDTKGNLLAEFRGRENVDIGWSPDYRAVFSPDGSQILTAGGDGTARLWDTKGNLKAEFQRHNFRVNSTVFSPDGRQIITSGVDKTVRLWDTKGNLLAIFRGHEEGVNSAIFSPDGSQILTASDDRTARLWNLSVGIKVSAAEVAFINGNQLSSQGTIESRQLALQKLEEALALYRADRNYAQAALTLLSMGKIYANFGQFQSALDSYNQALPLSQQAGAKAEEATIINSFGQLYTDLADPKSALDYYNQALPLFYQLNDQATVANTLNNIGDIYAATGNWKNALDSYNKALVISRPAGNLAAEATALTGIGSTYIASKEWSTALNAYNQALNISRHLNDKVKETTVLNQMGKIQAALGQNSTALENYNQALSLSQQLGYKTEEAHILYNQAILNRQQNNLAAAKTPIETAINIIENLRTQIASQELRQSYFARNQDYYQFYIDLLMQLHQKNPDKGYDAQAFHASERARARSLLELLSEASANIRQGVDPQLLAQEQNLQQQLSEFQTRKYQIVSAKSTQEAVDEIQQKIDTVLKELAQIEAKIRASSPRYAALKYPEPLNLQQIQQQVIDDNTLLLEYSLGEERSYLWAVTKTSFTSYELPSRTEIEATAKNFRDTLTKPTTRTSPQMVAESAALLSQMILAPVASELGNKRLLIVADGALQYIPFGALTLEKSEAPLIVKHEVVNLPSASTLAILRRDMATRQPAPKTIALFADPVFSTNDERLKGTSTSPVTKNQTVENLPLEAQQLQRAASDAEIYWTRLPFTRTEAEQILALVPDDLEKQAFDFTANRTTATNPDLSQYRIVHFATHGFANSKHPELSGLVLSLVDEKGTFQNGYLRLNDIFNLNLPAELVVLSACQTGLGKDIKGEGLVGLTRGFMYAGAPRVVVSLWSVEDQVTSELMTRFYKKMLQDKLAPAAALRAAQIEVLQLPEWQSPYYWAAFGLQGEWN